MVKRVVSETVRAKSLKPKSVRAKRNDRTPLSLWQELKNLRRSTLPAGLHLECGVAWQSSCCTPLRVLHPALRLDSTERWLLKSQKPEGPRNSFYLYPVVLHEIGHCLSSIRKASRCFGFFVKRHRDHQRKARLSFKEGFYSYSPFLKTFKD